MTDAKVVEVTATATVTTAPRPRPSFGWLMLRVIAMFCTIGAFTWMTYAGLHFAKGNSIVPFIVSGAMLLFAGGVWQKDDTKAAADILLPFLKELPRFGRRSTDAVADDTVLVTTTEEQPPRAENFP